MPSTATNKATMFGDDYDRLGHYVQDDTLVPYYNPADSGVDILPGEPILIQFGAANAERVFLSNTIIRPGEISMVKRGFTADFPCDFSANMILGDQVMWDIDTNKASLAADVTNGFILGNISYAIDSTIKNQAPAVDGNDRVICATTASTVCRVISVDAEPTVKGTVTNL